MGSRGTVSSVACRGLAFCAMAFVFSIVLGSWLLAAVLVTAGMVLLGAAAGKRRGGGLPAVPSPDGFVGARDRP